MAKKSNRNSRRSRGMKKIQPSVLSMAFRVPAGNSTVDLSQSASILNRRFYRQGIVWAVSGIRVFKANPTETGAVGISWSRLPATWSMSNGWEKAFRAWNKQQKDAVEAAGAESAVARFRDFKIHMDTTHVASGFANNLLPLDASGNIPVPGEWEESLIVVPNQTLDATGSRVDPKEYSLHAVGVNDNGGISRGIVEGYADSRAYPQSPDPVSPPIDSFNNWMRDMFDVGNDNQETTQNATDRNDDLPYTQVNYPGGETQLPGLQLADISYFSAGTNSNKLFMKGDTVPCGLIRFFSDQQVDVIIDVVPGHHKGYLCQPMTEM